MTEPENHAFSVTFGEPESVLTSNIAEYLGIFSDAQFDYYHPPLSKNGLVKIAKANAHHGTIPYFKRNVFIRHFVPSKVISIRDMGNSNIDFSLLGNAYFKRIENRYGHTIGLKHLPGINMRRMKDPEKYCRLRAGNDPIEYKRGEIIQLKEYDPSQEIYGIPQYIGGIQSVLLNEDSTLFRRKYFKNGAHMGYIFYMADGKLSDNQEKELSQTICQSKGAGNFKSMFLNLPGGKKDSVQIIPIGDIATKDEFEKIKDITRNDILSMWRMPAALAGIMPENTGGFGDIEKISRVHYENEVEPIQAVFKQLNEYLPRSKHIQFSAPKYPG